MDKPITKEWAWCEKTSASAKGPFGTYEEALRNAREDMGKGVVVEIGNVNYPDPVSYIQDDLDYILERMDEAACDDGYRIDDGIFYAELKASEVLTRILREWAREYISLANHVWIITGEKEVST